MRSYQTGPSQWGAIQSKKRIVSADGRANYQKHTRSRSHTLPYLYTGDESESDGASDNKPRRPLRSPLAPNRDVQRIRDNEPPKPPKRNSSVSRFDDSRNHDKSIAARKTLCSPRKRVLSGEPRKRGLTRHASLTSVERKEPLSLKLANIENYIRAASLNSKSDCESASITASDSTDTTISISGDNIPCGNNASGNTSARSKHRNSIREELQNMDNITDTQHGNIRQSLHRHMSVTALHTPYQRKSGDDAEPGSIYANTAICRPTSREIARKQRDNNVMESNFSLAETIFEKESLRRTFTQIAYQKACERKQIPTVFVTHDKNSMIEQRGYVFVIDLNSFKQNSGRYSDVTESEDVFVEMCAFINSFQSTVENYYEKLLRKVSPKAYASRCMFYLRVMLTPALEAELDSTYNMLSPKVIQFNKISKLRLRDLDMDYEMEKQARARKTKRGRRKKRKRRATTKPKRVQTTMVAVRRKWKQKKCQPISRWSYYKADDDDDDDDGHGKDEEDSDAGYPFFMERSIAFALLFSSLGVVQPERTSDKGESKPERENCYTCMLFAADEALVDNFQTVFAPRTFPNNLYVIHHPYLAMRTLNIITSNLL